MNKYGKEPEDLGLIDVSLPEVMYYLYLPISTPGLIGYHVPTQLRPLIPLINAVRQDVSNKGRNAKWRNRYVYITVKKMFVSPQVTANRPGWHCDGFGTDDLNYIWYDSIPTLFSIGHFDVTEGDHVKSLEEFEAQAGEGGNIIVTYPERHLLKLDPYVVHAVDTNVKDQVMRTFVKVSVSDDLYNLKDNSINPMFPQLLEQKKYDREVVRNDPHQAQRDSYKPVTDDHFA